MGLLGFVNTSANIVGAFSPTGVSWILEFYIYGSLALFANMVGHIVCYQYQHLERIITELTLFFGLFTMLEVLMVRLHARQCTAQIPENTSRALMAISTLLLACSLAGVSYNVFKRRQFYCKTR